ncbi:GATA transcription factor 4-like protein [Tanacetum coccineum]
MDFYAMSSSGQDYSTVDELLDFSNDDSNTFSPSSNDVILHQHHHNMASSSSPTNNTFNYNYNNNENNNYDFATAYNHSTNFTDNLCVPSDDVAELEWLANIDHYSSRTSSSSKNTTEGGIVRRCTHCSSEKTPQWRSVSNGAPATKGDDDRSTTAVNGVGISALR